MFDANEVINGLYGFVYDENGKQMQETKAFEANVDYDKEEGNRCFWFWNHYSTQDRQ